jgi:hypothetical protein
VNPRSSRTRFRFFWTANVSAMTLLAFALLVFVPRMAIMFADLGLRPPDETAILFALCRSPAGVIGGMMFLLLVQMLAYTQFADARSLVLIVFTVLALLAVSGIVLALGLPLLDPLNSVVGSGG